MKTCKLIKVVSEFSEYNFYYKVIGIGLCRVFNNLCEAEKFIFKNGYTYEFSEIITDAF